MIRLIIPVPFAFIIIPALFGVSCFSKTKNTDLLEFPAEENVYTIRIVPMTEWGGIPFTGERTTHKPRLLTIHHSGTERDDTKEIQNYLQDLQTWSRNEKQWSDIPYHFMISRDGLIFKTRDFRYPGDTNTEYNTDGHILTCVIGNFENKQPTVEQIESLINLLAWQCSYFDIKPETVRGHKDYIETLCPGRNLYRYLESGFLNKEITKRIGKVQLK